MAEEWEIDVLSLTLNDLVALEGASITKNAREVRDLLGRLVQNKTAEEIGSLSISELNERLEAIGKTINALAVPKESTTP